MMWKPLQAIFVPASVAALAAAVMALALTHDAGPAPPASAVVIGTPTPTPGPPGTCTVTLTLVRMKVVKDTEPTPDDWIIRTLSRFGEDETPIITADQGETVELNRTVATDIVPKSSFPLLNSMNVMVEELDPGTVNDRGVEHELERVFCPFLTSFAVIVEGRAVPGGFLEGFAVDLTYKVEVVEN